MVAESWNSYSGDALFGLMTCYAWLTARWERPELLAVEEDYFYPTA
ncbi:hypothetical protein GCM10011609_85460 [Lentzea pudingi]|uniref:Uncharacterized protein n=1 Tax=Lentzea pudingi TaxID=1789439 RepID=A0ABQ2IVN0_9PSEU|nr:hypothetical protein [Lentzea pudingi]GGN28875.1 hypothetical protein GCM10011609_85460 [Lentzea pudingi]